MRDWVKHGNNVNWVKHVPSSPFPPFHPLWTNFRRSDRQRRKNYYDCMVIISVLAFYFGWLLFQKPTFFFLRLDNRKYDYSFIFSCAQFQKYCTWTHPTIPWTVRASGVNLVDFMALPNATTTHIHAYTNRPNKNNKCTLIIVSAIIKSDIFVCFPLLLLFFGPAQTQCKRVQRQKEEEGTKAGDKKFSNGTRNSSIITLTVIQTRFECMQE